MSARRPIAKFPNRCRAWCVASPTAAGCREFATRIGLPLHRSRGLPPHNLGDASAVPARPGVEESHPPAPAPPASRFGWRRSGEPRAARPARRRSDDACSRAWPDQWDLDRSGHRRGPRGWNNSPRPPATNQSGRSARASPVAQSASDPKRPPVANRAGAASTSSPTRTRVPAGARVVGHLVAVVEESARRVRQDPTTDLQATPRPYAIHATSPTRTRFGRFCYALLAHIDDESGSSSLGR
jgi:hypothetical protein